MIRVVLDTNVFISALMFGGRPGNLLDLAFLQSFHLVISPELLEELDEKLLSKFAVSASDRAMIRVKLESIAEVIRPQMALSVIKDDPDDDRVLECALEGRAEYIVTGDRDLLKLGSYEDISIVSVRQFLDSIEAEDSKPT